MAAITVFSGVERRRRWSDDQKDAFVASAFAPGAVVSEVARQADLSPGQIYRWRAELAGRRTCKSQSFMEVMVTPPDRVGAERAEVIVVELGGALVRICAKAPPPLVAAVLNALSR